MQNPPKRPVRKRSKTKSRGRNGGRTPLPEDEKTEPIHVSLPRWLVRLFKLLVPRGIDRSRLIIGWVRAYCTSNGETDRLLAQSPLAIELISYLEAQGTPEADDFADRLQSLIVAREVEEMRVEGRIEKVGDAYIV